MPRRLVLVTGSGSGIGRAVAYRFAQAGDVVACTDLDEASAIQTAEACGLDCFGAQMDVSDESSVRDLFRSLGQRAHRPTVDVLVNVAGIGITTAVPDTSLDDWIRVEAVNSRGTFLCCRQALPEMIAAGGGSIVNVASIAGLVGLRNRAAYCASKGAVISLTRAMALDHVADHVRVNAVCPGTVDSPWVRRLVSESGESMAELVARQPMRRLGGTDEIAEAVHFLASDAAAFITGTALAIDGGLTAG